MSVWAGQQISRLRQTSVLCMQYGSEPPSDKEKNSGRFDTELLLWPIFSCNQHHCAAIAAAVSGEPCCQQSIAPSPVPAPSRFLEWSHHSEQPLPFTPCRLLLDIFQTPQPASYCHVNFRRPAYSFNHKREHSQAPGYHLSNRVSINSAFQKQDKRRTGQFVVRRAEKMTTAVFSIKTLKVPRAF